MGREPKVRPRFLERDHWPITKQNLPGGIADDPLRPEKGKWPHRDLVEQRRKIGPLRNQWLVATSRGKIGELRRDTHRGRLAVSGRISGGRQAVDAYSPCQKSARSRRLHVWVR